MALQIKHQYLAKECNTIATYMLMAGHLENLLP